MNITKTKEVIIKIYNSVVSFINNSKLKYSKWKISKYISNNNKNDILSDIIARDTEKLKALEEFKEKWCVRKNTKINYFVNVDAYNEKVKKLLEHIISCINEYELITY